MLRDKISQRAKKELTLALDPPQPKVRPPFLSYAAKAILLSILAAASGFLLFYPFSPSNHIHFRELTGMQGHRGAAFCSFTRTCSSEDDVLEERQQQSGAFLEEGRTRDVTTRQPSPRLIVLDEPPQEEKVEKDIIHGAEESLAEPVFISTAPPISLPGSTLAEARAALSTRVCGSPAIAGYTKIDADCINRSPTNQWYQSYYRAGGKQRDLMVYYDQAASYDGIAVAWGLTNKKDTVQECAAHCLQYMPGDIPGPFQHMPCNVFVYCPMAECWEPDAWHATRGDCWLKFTEAPAKPEVNCRGDLVGAVKLKHPDSPPRVEWVSGVLLPHGVQLTNGSWSPRVNW